MARKQIESRTDNAPVAHSQRTLEVLDALDLANNTRGLVQFLDDMVTRDRSQLVLEHNSIDGLSTFLQLIDANLLQIIRAMDPDHPSRGSLSAA